MRGYLNLFFISIFTLITFSAIGQQNTRSPYSMFGVGLRHYDGYADNAAIGKNGASYRFVSNFSMVNPSSLSALNHAAFNVGASIDMGKLRTTTKIQPYTNAGLAYISLGVPLKKINGGFAFGLFPYSDVGYNMIETKDSSGITVSNAFEGNGGFSTLKLGLGIKVWKYASLGFNYSHLFGRLDESNRKIYPGSRVVSSFAEINSVYLKGSRFDLGVQFHTNADSGINHIFGIVVSNAAHLKGDVERTGYTYNDLTGGSEFVRDTVFHETVSKKMTLPSSLNLSYSFGNHEKWQVSAGYNSTFWNNFKNIYGDNGGLVNDHGFSLGGFICPNPVFDKTIKTNKIFTYLKSIRYSAGYFNNSGYIKINGTNISEQGLTLGFGFPFTKKHINPDNTRVIITSRIFVTGEFGRRGTKNNQLIQEDYFKLTLGLNLSDSWFNKKLFN